EAELVAYERGAYREDFGSGLALPGPEVDPLPAPAVGSAARDDATGVQGPDAERGEVEPAGDGNRHGAAGGGAAPLWSSEIPDPELAVEVVAPTVRLAAGSQSARSSDLFEVQPSRHW